MFSNKRRMGTFIRVIVKPLSSWIQAAKLTNEIMLIVDNLLWQIERVGRKSKFISQFPANSEITQATWIRVSRLECHGSLPDIQFKLAECVSLSLKVSCRNACRIGDRNISKMWREPQLIWWQQMNSKKSKKADLCRNHKTGKTIQEDHLDTICDWR